jgi:hypothetical protein
MLRKPFYASLAALGLLSMMGIAGNAMAATPAVWVGTADYTLAPGGTAANAEKVGPFNEFDFSSKGVTLLKAGVANNYDGYYQSFVNQHFLDGVIALSPKLNNSYELTVAASFHEVVSGTNPLDIQLTGGDFNMYFGDSANHNFNTDFGFTDGASILHGTIIAGSGLLNFKPSSTTASGYSELTIHVDSYNTSVFDPATIASGDSIFTLRVNNSLDGSFLNPIGSVMGHSYNAANGDLKVASDGNLVLSVPEPETYAMMLSGLGLVGFMARRRKVA